MLVCTDDRNESSQQHIERNPVSVRRVECTHILFLSRGGREIVSGKPLVLVLCTGNYVSMIFV